MRGSYHPKAEHTRLVALNDGLPLMHPQGKRIRYQEQRTAAARRGIAWEFSFEDWVAVWNESGCWEQRGCRKGQYLMARHGDVGPYSKDNVAIVPNAVNTREGVAKRAKPFGNTSRLGTGKGFTYRSEPNHANRPYAATFRGKSLGYFATEAEARAAYLEAVASFTRATHPLQRIADSSAPIHGSAYLQRKG